MRTHKRPTANVKNAPQRARLTPHAIVSRCRAGARLTCSSSRTGTIFLLQPPGDRVPTRYALKAIAGGKLKPARDGLFPDNNQSWIAAS